MPKRISFDLQQFINICKYMDDSDCGEFFKAIKDRVDGSTADEEMCENIVRIALSMVDYRVEGENKE